MLACLTILLVAPAKAKVTIFTDSEAIIKGMVKFKEFMQLSVRKREKIPNFPIWMTIAHVIEVLKLQVVMTKVKAHSSNRLNDRTDQIAKAAARSAIRLNLNYTRLPDVNLMLTCDYLLIEASSRRCIKQMQEAKNFHQYLQLHRNNDLNTLTKLQHINWSSTSFMLNCNFTDKDCAFTSFAQHQKRTFKYKIFSDELPTLVRLK